jgi:hypothetical protein
MIFKPLEAISRLHFISPIIKIMTFLQRIACGVCYWILENGILFVGRVLAKCKITRRTWETFQYL